MSTKTHARVLNGTGESVFVIEHEGIEVKGATEAGVIDTGVVVTDFAGVGNYIVSDDTTGDGGTISVIETAGTLSTVKLSGPAVITVTKDTASSVNVYIEDGVLKVQNLTGGAIDLTVKPFA
jgi:hypothetical protein